MRLHVRAACTGSTAEAGWWTILWSVPAKVNFEWLWRPSMWSSSKSATVGQTSGEQARPAVQERWTDDDVAADRAAEHRLLGDDSIETVAWFT